MGNNNLKIMNVAFLLAAGLTFWVTNLLMSTFAATFAVVARFSQNVFVHHGLPIAVSAAVFAYLNWNQTIRTWSEEVIVELKKVVWPTLDQTKNMTIVVCIMVLISGAVLGVFDVVSGQALTSGILMLAGLLK